MQIMHIMQIKYVNHIFWKIITKIYFRINPNASGKNDSERSFSII